MYHHVRISILNYHQNSDIYELTLLFISQPSYGPSAAKLMADDQFWLSCDSDPDGRTSASRWAVLPICLHSHPENTYSSVVRLTAVTLPMLIMNFKLTHSIIVTIVMSVAASAGAPYHKSTSPTEAAKPCTISSVTGAFYDLNELKITPPKDDKPPPKGVRVDDWKARGYDYHDNQANFTMNICGAISTKPSEYDGIDPELWKNVSAYYELGPKRFSIGLESSTLQLRGRRLVLEYKNGSPCGTQNTNQELQDKNSQATIRRKSSLISFHCDKDPLAAQSSGIVTYVGNLDDECSYHFEVLSKVACARAEPAKQSLGPGAVFAVIGLIAILVYFLGGVFYQRNVAHARGWRQLPNYSIWAGIGSFVKDIFTIITSFCSRFIPRRQGYTALSNGYSRGRRSEDENRLIDHLDEEWDD